MQLDVKNLKSYTTEQLYGILFSTIDKVYKYYDFLKLNRVEYRNLVLDAINETINVISDDKLDIFDQIFKKNLIEHVNNYITNIFNDEDKFLNIVVDFINNNVSSCDTYDKSLMEFNKLSKFFKKLNYTPSIDIIINLLKTNTHIDNIIKIIVNNNMESITSGNLNEVSTNQLLLSFIDGYCAINEIEIAEKDLDISELGNCVNITKQYLKEISQFPLLTRKEEIELATRIRNGDEKAREKFINSNLRLSVSVAKRYVCIGLDFIDVVMEGNQGLIKAVDRFDVSKGYKFSTYATCWIRQSITRAIAEKGRNIRIPVYKIEELVKYNKIKNKLEMNLGREATIYELAETLNTTVDKINKLEKLKYDTTSLNQIIGEDDDGKEFGDFIPDDFSVEDTVLDKINSDQLLQVLDTVLDDREKVIIRGRMGFDGRVKTLEELGSQLGITRERVRQLEKRAKGKLKKPSVKRSLAITSNANATRSLPNKLNNNGDALNTSKIDTNKEREANCMKYDCTSACKDLKAKKNKIEILVTKLTEEETRLFKLRYGTDYENDVVEVNWEPNDYIKFSYHLRPKLLELLKNIKVNRTQSLKKKLKCKEEELEAILDKLNDAEKALLALNCGVDLEHPKRSEYCSVKDKERFKTILMPRMENLLKEIRKENKDNEKLKQITRENKEDKNAMPEKSIIKEKNDETSLFKQKRGKSIIPAYELIGCSKEQLMLAIPLITDNQRNLFYKANGDDIEHPKRSEHCSKKDLNKYYQNVIPELRCKIAYNIIRKVDLKHKKGGEVIPAYELIGCYREELLAELSNLTVRQKELFNLANGDDIDHPKRSGNFTRKDLMNYFTNVIKALRNKIAINIIKNSRNEDVKQNTVENPNAEKQEDLTKYQDNMLPKTETEISVKLPQPDIIYEEKEPVIDFIPKKEENPNSASIPSKQMGESDYKRLLNIMSLMQLSKKDSAILLKKILLAYKEKMGEFIDDVIAIIMDDASKEETLDSSNKGPYQKDKNNIS